MDRAKNLYLPMILLLAAFAASNCSPKSSPKNQFLEVKVLLHRSKEIKDVEFVLSTVDEWNQFLNICDQEVLAKDELNRSAACLCYSAIYGFASGDKEATRVFRSSENLKIVNGYQWSNENLFWRFEEDANYGRKIVPTYYEFTDRVFNNERDPK